MLIVMCEQETTLLEQCIFSFLEEGVYPPHGVEGEGQQYIPRTRFIHTNRPVVRNSSA